MVAAVLDAGRNAGGERLVCLGLVSIRANVVGARLRQHVAALILRAAVDAPGGCLESAARAASDIARGVNVACALANCAEGGAVCLDIRRAVRNQASVEHRGNVSGGAGAAVRGARCNVLELGVGAHCLVFAQQIGVAGPRVAEVGARIACGRAGGGSGLLRGSADGGGCRANRGIAGGLADSAHGAAQVVRAQHRVDVLDVAVGAVAFAPAEPQQARHHGLVAGRRILRLGLLPE